ncbi:MAG: dephospho-CoA kinase [Clostridia bacterium]|nr:dephospho-CoA kinase [Clostridia bacterium]
MRYIGLTGRSGTGKSVVAQCASELGIPCIDCDKLYRSMTEKPTAFLNAIAGRFGSKAAEGGQLNRAYLRDLVFSDSEARRDLDRLTGAFMGEYLEELSASLSGVPFVLLDAPTLFQTGLRDRCGEVICCISSDDACVSRIQSRDGITEAEARRRLDSQLTDSFYREQDVILLENNDTENAFRKEAKKLLRRLIETENGRG